MFERFFTQPAAEEVEVPGTPEEHIRKVIDTLNAKGLQMSSLTAEAVRAALFELHGRNREEVLDWAVEPKRAETEEEQARIEEANLFLAKMKEMYPNELIDREIAALQ